MQEKNIAPSTQGMCHPSFEHDACGIGMLADIKGCRRHKMITDSIEVLNRLSHRGGKGLASDTGDGAGLFPE